jgi:hypothetical protein
MMGCRTTYNTSIYLGKGRQNATLMMKATHMIVKSLARRVKDIDYKFTQTISLMIPM